MIDLIFATDVNWGSSTQAHVYRGALTSTLKLVQTEDHIRGNCYRIKGGYLDFFTSHRIKKNIYR